MSDSVEPAAPSSSTPGQQRRRNRPRRDTEPQDRGDRPRNNQQRRRHQQPQVPLDCDEIEKLVRRRLVRSNNKATDIYVTDLTDFTDQLSKANCLLSAGTKEVNIFGIGLGVSRAINLSLQASEKVAGEYLVEPKTVTIELRPPGSNDPEGELHGDLPRFNSCIRIKLQRRVVSTTA